MNLNSLFSFSDHLEKLSKDGDPLDVLDTTVDFEYFRTWLVDGLGYGGATPDENTICHFRNCLTETGTLKRVMKAFDWKLHKKGYILDLLTSTTASTA